MAPRLRLRKLRRSRRHCVCGLLASALLLLLANSAVVADEPSPEHIHNSVRLTEEHYRFNAQNDGILLFSHSEEDRGLDDDYELEAHCATGRFGAAERWKIWFVDYDEQLYRTQANALEPLVVYMNDARQVQAREPPCVAILDKLRAYMMQRSYNKQAVEVETLVYNRGFVPSRQPATPRWVVLDGISIPMARQEDDLESKAINHSAESETQQQQSHALRAGDMLAFASALDTLDGIATRDSYPALTEEMRKPYVDEFSSSPDDDLEELRRDHMELLLQEERELIQGFSEGSGGVSAESFWASSFTLDDWEQLRQQTPAQDRKSLAEGWTSTAKLWLASSGNFSMGVNCLRRAVGWYPGFVPAYLELSSLLLNHAQNQNASCQTMEKMLESIDPSEFRSSGEMSSVLTANFPHCSVIIRMANLWETSTLFRYVVTGSVVLSFLHGVCVALYFFHKFDRYCCCFRLRSQKSSNAGDSSSSSSSTRESEHGGKGGGRKAKRE